ncbi:hypothetical protein Tco_0781881 [Tanacetum coccineum]
MGASSQRCCGSLYPKMLWETLLKDVVEASWQIEGASCTQRKVSSVPFVFSIPFVLSWGGSISPDSFLSSILLLVVMVVIVVVTVILVVIVVAIIGVVIVVTIIGVVVVVIVGGVPSIIKLSFVNVGSLHKTML